MRFANQQFDNEYVDCTFRNCKFQYNGGDFNIERIRFDSLQFTVGGPAARTVLLLQSLWAGDVGRRAVLGLLESSATNSSTQ